MMEPSPPSKASNVELNAVRSTTREDDLALARLGKKAVLKVLVTAVNIERFRADGFTPRGDSASFPSWASAALS